MRTDRFVVGTSVFVALGCSGSGPDSGPSFFNIGRGGSAALGPSPVATGGRVNDEDSSWDIGDADVVCGEDDKDGTDNSQIGVQAFDPEVIVQYRVTMEPSLLQDMESHGIDEVYRPAALEIEAPGLSVQYSHVGFRYKGQWTLEHCFEWGNRRYDGDCARISMRIKFSEYDDDCRFSGLKKLNLHVMSQDGAKLRERLAYEAHTEFGVDAPRSAFAQLIINDAAPMLVLAVEMVDGRYSAFHFPEGGDGNLYKEAWPTPGVTTTELINALETNDDPEDMPDVSAFQELAAVLKVTSRDTFEQDLTPFLDIEQLLRFMALDRALRNWDGVNAFYPPGQDLGQTAFTPHNYYWYRDDGPAPRFHLIPWDLDNTVWRAPPEPLDPYMDSSNSGYVGTPLPEWNVAPSSCAPVPVWYGAEQVQPPGCDSLIRLLAEVGGDEFARLGGELLSGPLEISRLNEKIDRWEAQIRPLIEEDPGIDTGGWEWAVGAYRDRLAEALTRFRGHLGEFQ